MQVSHATKAAVASFDDPHLVSAAGLLPIMYLEERAGLRSFADRRLSVPTDKESNAGKKASSLVGGMKKIFTSCYAPSTLGLFLRSCTFGQVRQLDAVASRLLVNLAAEAPIVPAPTVQGLVFVDVDDTVIEVHGYQNQGTGFGYSAVRGINALLATVSPRSAPRSSLANASGRALRNRRVGPPGSSPTPLRPSRG